MAEEDWTIVPKVASNKWQEEEDEDIKENWDDEDGDDDEQSKASSTGTESNQQQTSEQQQPQATKKLTSGKKKSKALKEKIQQKEESERSQPKTADELLAEKLENQRLIEEGDLALAKETFGISGNNDSTSALNNIRLATKDDFEDFRKALDDKLSPYIRSPHYMTFLDGLFRTLASSLEIDDIRKLNATLTALYNEKIKLQKNKGKKNKKAPTIMMEREKDYSYGKQMDQYEDEYDDFL
nr:eukaryotic translation initiation factor 3 subunit J-A-like isoform X2 [Dermatophagoides farinae]